MVAKALQVIVSFDSVAFGSALRAWRKRERMTLRQCARATQSSQSLLSRVELGRIVPRGDVMCRLMLLTGLDYADYCTTRKDEN